ncbi:MAG: pilin [Candidatus Nomurabacteria bacterium]|jgi:uncharacterized membrane protein|nr:pilin [Candidatus Nomurabacteria bacterium]
MKSTTKKILGAVLVVPMMVFAVIGAAVPAGAVKVVTGSPNSTGNYAVGGTEIPFADLTGEQASAAGKCDTQAGAKYLVVNGSENVCVDKDGKPISNGTDITVGTIINAMLYIIGILCVVFIIWGGITYTMSRGDSKKVESAKNTILYAVIGLIVALLSWTIMNFFTDLI